MTERDPIVREVRRTRAKLLREAGGTLAGLHRLLLAERETRRKPQLGGKTKRAALRNPRAHKHKSRGKR